MDNQQFIPDKPFKNTNEMLNKLKDRNLIIEDPDFAEMCLLEYSYYSLINGHKASFIDSASPEIYIPGLKFEDLYELHLVESDLNALILKYILKVEISLKTKLSYQIANDFGVYTNRCDSQNLDNSDYLYRKNYRSYKKAEVNGTLASIKKVISIKNSKVLSQPNEMIVHYINNHNHIPPWILVTALSFGLTIKWFNILKHTQKVAIIQKFNLNSSLPLQQQIELFEKLLKLLKVYRNKFAHANMIKNWTVLPIPNKKDMGKVTNEQTNIIFENIIDSGQHRRYSRYSTFLVICSCFILLQDINVKRQMLKDLHFVLDAHSNRSILAHSFYELLGLPGDLFERIDNI